MSKQKAKRHGHGDGGPAPSQVKLVNLIGPILAGLIILVIIAWIVLMLVR